MHDYASKEHVVAALRKGIRLDGRKLDEYRPITLTVNDIKNAEGSAKVLCGETILLAGVKMAVGKPYPDTPESGVLVVNAELLPISSPMFEPGPPTFESIELSRVIDRGIRESKVIDEKALCIKAGEAVWMVNLDVVPLNTDGQLIDMGGLAGLAALYSARMPTVVDGKVDYKHLTDEKIPLDGLPIPVTVCKMGGVLFVDPSDDEWVLIDARLTVTTVEDGTICAMQKGGEGTFTIEEIERCIDIALAKSKELRAILKAAA